MSRPIRWLHLSDLHYGGAGKALWEQVEDDFHRSLDETVHRLGAPDLLLFTGDLAFSGSAEQYGEVDRFLDVLLKRLTRNNASEPLLLPVPGNHDLIRPTGKDARLYHILRSFDGTTDDPTVAQLHHELWYDRDASFIEPLCAGYRDWFERRVRPSLGDRGAHVSHFPCDFTLEITPEGAFPLAVVGLNSTWIQYTGGDFEGRLLIPIEQLRTALAPPDEPSPYAVFERSEQALLLMHQPPHWFSERGGRIFDASIYKPKTFTLCLYGHMHESDSRFLIESGGEPRAFFQSPSLFGLEKWGKSNEDRAMGFTWGELHQDGEVRLWPFKYQERGDRSWSSKPDAIWDASKKPSSSVLRCGLWPAIR